MDLTLPQTEQRLRELGTAVFDLGGLFERLGQLTDRRGERGRRYALPALLLLVVLAKLAGEDTPSAIADWVATRKLVLCQALKLNWSRMPHHNTFRRVLAFVLEPEELDRVVSLHLVSLADRQGGLRDGRDGGLSRLIAFDGKTARGTICEENPQGTHLLAAYLSEGSIVLGQIEVADKENEILAAPALLGAIDLRAKVVMGDAMHSQRELSKQIRQGRGDFIWLIKENQPAVLEDLEQHFAAPTPTVLGNYLPDDFTVYEQREKGHGRLERRRITVSSELKGYTNWPGLEQVFRLERERVNLRTGEVEREVVYGLTSLRRKQASAKALFDFVRAYWGIENGLHNRRDVTFREDRTRLTVGNAGHVMASLNNLVIGLLRLAGFPNLAHARRVCNSLLNHPTYLSIAPSLT